MTEANQLSGAKGDPGAVLAVGEWMTVPYDEIKEDLLLARLRQARIPKKYLSKTLAAFIPRNKACKDLVKAAEEYIQHFTLHKGAAEGLMLKGAVGSGKTHIAIAILREIVAAGYSGLYCNVPEFFKEIRATYNSNTGPDESYLIDETREVDLLVLDDLGVEGRVLDPVRDRSKWLCERMYLIVNGRYEADRPIVMTTNCDLTALTEQFDERTVSRLAEMTRRHFPTFPDQDFRKLHMK